MLAKQNLQRWALATWEWQFSTYLSILKHPMVRKEKERGGSVTTGTGAAARAAAKPVVWTGKMMRRTDRERA